MLVICCRERVLGGEKAWYVPGFPSLVCSKVFGRVRWFTEERVGTQLRERHKVRTRWRGWKRFPHACIHDRLGLFKLPATVKRRSAHALA